MRIDRPASVWAERIEQKRNSLGHRRVIAIASSYQRDGDKARKRDGFEKSTACRLDRFEHLQASSARGIPC